MQPLTIQSLHRNITNQTTEQVTASRGQSVLPIATQLLSECSSGCPKMLHQRQCQCLSFQLELKKLEYFLDDEGQEYLQAVAANHTKYEPLLKRLKSEGVYGGLYQDPETCNTLYWGLKNNHLNQSQFIENYHLLSLSLTFLTTYFLGEPMAWNPKVINTTTPDKDVTWENLECAEYKFLMTPKFANFYENAFRGLSRDEFTTDTSYDHELRLKHIADWMHTLKWHGVAVTFESFYSKVSPAYRLSDPHKLYLKVSSLNALVKKIHGEEPVLLAPGFGYGDYDDLKILRQNDEHPFALWHFELPSLDHPDKVWIGALSYLHDGYHGRMINILTKASRDQCLDFDTKYCMPLCAFYKRQLIHNKECQQNDSDKLFIEGFSSLVETLKRNRPSSDNIKMSSEYPWGFNLSTFNESAVRQFVDQVFTKKNEPEEFMKKFHLRSLKIDYRDVRRSFETNYMIFYLLKEEKIYELEWLLGVKVEAYPAIRECLIRSREEQGDEPTEFDKMRSQDENADEKWHIDFWIDWLQRNTDTPLESGNPIDSRKRSDKECFDLKEEQPVKKRIKSSISDVGTTTTCLHLHLLSTLPYGDN